MPHRGPQRITDTSESERAKIERLALLLATAGGAGHAPVAPGSFGSAVGVLLYLPLSAAGPLVYTGASLALLGAGIWSAEVAERVYQRRDDPRIVIDEVVGQLLTLAPLLLLVPAAQRRSPLWLLAGFLLFRLIDVWKPGPVAAVERRFEGGAGVMLDDVAAGLVGGLLLCGLLAALAGFEGAP
jgi:phosphatidylglycerophosphatase A